MEPPIPVDDEIAPPQQRPRAQTAPRLGGGGAANIFRALQNHGFRPYLVALVASGLGLWMQMFALGWLVVQVATAEGRAQQAPFYLGLVGLARAGPALLLGPFGGAFADRFPRRSILMVTQAAAAGLALALAALTVLGAVALWPILLIAAASSAAWAFDIPTRQSLVPSLVGGKDLMSAIGLTAAASNATQILGPVVAGVLLATTNAATLFVAISGSFLVCVILLRLVPQEATATAPAQSVRASLIEGAGYMRANSSIRRVLAAELVIAFLAWPYVLLAPAIVQNDLHAGATTLSLLLAATGVGALIGSLVVASFGALADGARLLVGLQALVGAALIVFGTQSALVGVVAGGLLIGATLISFEGLANGLLQSNTPNELRGRVLSARSLILTGVMPLGQLALGSSATLRGSTQQILLGGGVVVMILALAAFVRTVLMPGAGSHQRRDRGMTIEP